MSKSCCGLFLLLFSLLAHAEEGDSSLFSKYLSGFRQEHHFSLITGQTKGTWKITRFGDIQNKSEPSKGIFLKARYSFHLPLVGPFGYALGTSMGVLKHLGTKSKVFYPKVSLQLPSFFLAGIYQVNSRLQFILGLESYLERVEGIEDRSSNTTMDATMIVASDQVFVIDYFYDLGERLELSTIAVKVSFIGLAILTASLKMQSSD